MTSIEVEDVKRMKLREKKGSMSASSVKWVRNHGQWQCRDACAQMTEKDTEFLTRGAGSARQQQGRFRHDECVRNPGREGRGDWWSRSRDHDHPRIYVLSRKNVSCSCLISVPKNRWTIGA